MAAERLFVVYGSGNDSIGLVGKITTPLAEAGGNIVDLRQDVLHGLFTIYLVVDFTRAGAGLDRCRALVAAIGETTGLTLAAAPFAPVPRDPEKQNLLCTLVGEDKPGVAAKISATLSRYQINIEFSKMIAREDVFLMELLVDCRTSAIPLVNLEREITAVMADMKIKAVIQRDDVFNKKKRWLLFSLGKSLMPGPVAGELARLAGVKPEAVRKAYDRVDSGSVAGRAAALLDRLGIDVLEKAAAAARPTAATQELVQTLKTFGYRVALSAAAADTLVARIARLLGIDAAAGAQYAADPDTRRLTADPDAVESGRDEARFIRALAERERISPDEITVIRDRDSAAELSPGLRLDWDLKPILELVNNRVLSADQLVGLFGWCGVPSL